MPITFCLELWTPIKINPLLALLFRAMYLGLMAFVKIMRLEDLASGGANNASDALPMMYANLESMIKQKPRR